MKNYVMSSKMLTLLLMVLCAFSANAKTIDFDAKYGTQTSATMASAFTKAISEAATGDVLLFKSKIYDFGAKSITINKAVTISGKTASYDVTKIGAQNVTSIFRNLTRINLRANNIKFKHIDIRAKAGTGYFIFASHPDKVVNRQYKGILFQNSILQNASVLVYGGNGVGITYKNLSCYNFTRGAFLNDRRIDNNYSEKMHFEKCYFYPNQETMYFDTRAISFDAGNDEHAVTWNLFNTTIKDNIFDGAGVAFSKCRNAIVENNHFKGYSMYVDMVHMEEFTNNITVTGNRFQYVKPARGFYIDREGQPCNKITITHNKFIGKIGWVISSYSPSNLTFENNDFSQAEANNTNSAVFDFNYTHKESHFPYPLPITGLSFKNNTGLTNVAKCGKFIYTQNKWSTSNTIEGYPASKLIKTEVTANPKSLIQSGKTFRIQNKQSGQYLASGSSSKVILTSKKGDKSDLWTVTFKYPYRYEIQNVKTGDYLEVERGYNLADRKKDPVPHIYVELKSNYENTPPPAFFLRKLTEGNATYFEILPGSNEQKSRMVKVNNSAELELATNGEPIAATNYGKWKFIVSSGLKASVVENDEIENEIEKKKSSLKVYPNPASHNLFVENCKAENANYTIYTIGGTKVLTGTLKHNKIKVAKLNRGIYTIQVEDEKPVKFMKE